MGLFTNCHIMEFQPVWQERKQNVLSTQPQDSKETNVGSKYFVVPTVFSPEIQIHGWTFSGDEKYLQQETRSYIRRWFRNTLARNFCYLGQGGKSEDYLVSVWEQPGRQTWHYLHQIVLNIFLKIRISTCTYVHHFNQNLCCVVLAVFSFQLLPSVSEPQLV